MRKILTVDDSSSIRQMVNFTLGKAGYEVIEAVDGKDGLDKASGQKFDLIVTDLNMPNMDGIELLSHIKASETWKGVPVVMVSTEGSQAKVLEAVQLGAAGYVRKPFNAEQIKEKLAAFF